MPMIPDQIVEDIRARTDIAQVIGDRMSLKRSSGGWVGLCPFHHEKTPSFHVNDKRQTFKCFGCGEGGDVFSFLMKFDGMTFLDAARYLAEKCGVEIRTEEDDGRTARAKRLYLINAEAAAFFRRCLLTIPEAEAAREYLRSRDLTGEIAEAFGLGYDPDAWGALDGFARAHRFTTEEMVAAGLGTLPEGGSPDRLLRDRFHGRLMFPICDHTGRVVAFSARTLQKDAKAAKYVNSPETDVFKKARVLYALDKAQRAIAASPHREAILCEGQIDVIRCHACGFPRAVASEGTAFTAEHAHLLHRYADSAIELFDSDKAGRKAAVRTASILLAEGIPVRIAHLPEGGDPDSFLRTHPAADFQKVLDEASDVVPFVIDYYRSLEDAPDSPGATERIVQGVLQTVASCSSAVQKERMLQAAATGLSLPIDLLKGELAGVEEALRQQAERSALRAETVRRAEEARAAEAEREPEPAVPTPPQRPGATPVAAPSPPAEPPPDAFDVSVCEYLLNHAEEEPGTIDTLARAMPASLFPNSIVRRIVEAFYARVGSSSDPVLDLQEKDPAVADFLGRVSLRNDRTGTGEHFLAKDVAHNLIIIAWRRSLEALCAASEHAPDAYSPTEMAKRARCRAGVNALRRGDWESCKQLLSTLTGVDFNA